MSDEQETAVCDACGKRSDSELELPDGWYAIGAARGLPNGDEEELTGGFCSSACVKAFLDSKQ